MKIIHPRQKKSKISNHKKNLKEYESQKPNLQRQISKNKDFKHKLKKKIT